jgi:hypothetical protein
MIGNMTYSVETIRPVKVLEWFCLVVSPNYQFLISNFSAIGRTRRCGGQIISNTEIFKRLRGLKSNITILSRGGDRV